MGLRERIFIIGLMLSVRYEASRAEILNLQDNALFPSGIGCHLIRIGCTYNAYCNTIFDVNYQSTIVDNYNNHCKNVIHIENQYFLPINISFRNSRDDDTNFPTNDNYNRYYDPERRRYISRSPNTIIQSADFSNNDCIDMPYIQQLINLKTLNMSHNMLMIAELSNPENLDFLQEIDYSFNVIETIDVRKDEHPYVELKLLNLSYNSLTVIPEEILYHFIKLEKLDLSHNLITNINNMPFFGLKQILILNLSYNHIVNLSQSLAKLYNLKILYLQENKLSAILFSDINSLKSLNKVDLSCNEIETIESDVFNNMTQLSFVNLRSNKLKSLDIDMFHNSNRLEYIDLSQNEITKLPVYVFKQKNISHFSIAENKIEGMLSKGMFEGLKNVDKLDLSYQRITSIDDAAFLGIDNVIELLLNNNQISILKKHSFKLLTKLTRIDLSYNFISNVTLDTEDLVSLEYLFLSHNEITHIERKQLQFLNKLEFLDISNNKIISIEPNSFKLQPFLKTLLISNNHFQGSLSPNTFNGLQNVPELDLSYSFLTAISNGSFNGMGRDLISINISQCYIRNISYNAFINTGNLKTLDISHNKLAYLNINITEMTNLKTLFLHHNLIETLHDYFFAGMLQLQTLDLSDNNLLFLDDNVFNAIGNLEFLDMSNNFNLTVRFEIVKPLKKIKALKLSGTKANITFDSQQNSLLHLEMSNTGIRDLSTLKLGNINNLSYLDLSHNKISNLGEDIANKSSLHSLDLSYNMIRNLQPGLFTGCTNLNLLNISHNSINNINYGVFHGLLHLNVLDMSFNLLENLKDEKFYQMHSLEHLIVDYNKISFVTIEQFLGTSLKILSVGGNPLPCKALIKLKHDEGYQFQITAMVNDKSSRHNYYGVSCVDDNNQEGVDYKIENNFKTDGDQNILMDIRNILKDLTVNSVKHNDWISLSNILTNAQNSSTREELNNIISILRTFSNLTLEKDEINAKINEDIMQETKNTNSLIERILKVIVAKNYLASPLPSDNTSNDTKYLKHLKDLENSFILEKEKIVSEFDDKILALSKKIQVKTDNSNNKSPNFTEVCVALILLVLVSCVAFYFYKTQLTPFGQRHSRTMSTRQITVDMDNSNL